MEETNRCIKLSGLPANVTQQGIFQAFNSLNVEQVFINVGVAIVQFSNSGDAEAASFLQTHLSQLGSAEITSVSGTFQKLCESIKSPQTTKVVIKNYTQGIPSVDELIVIKNCDPEILSKLTTNKIKSQFKQFQSLNRVGCSERDIYLEIKDPNEPQKLNQYYPDLKIPIFGQHAQIDISNQQDCNKFTQIVKNQMLKDQQIAKQSPPSSSQALPLDDIKLTKMTSLQTNFYAAEGMKSTSFKIKLTNNNQGLDNLLSIPQSQYLTDCLQTKASLPDSQQNQVQQEKKIAEQKRIVQEQKIAEEKRITQEKRVAEEKRIAQEKRITEEKRIAQEKKIAEEKRILQEKLVVQQKRIAQQKRVAEEKRIADKIAEQARLAEIKKIELQKKMAAQKKELEEKKQKAEQDRLNRQKEEAIKVVAAADLQIGSQQARKSSSTENIMKNKYQEGSQAKKQVYGNKEFKGQPLSVFLPLAITLFLWSIYQIV